MLPKSVGTSEIERPVKEKLTRDFYLLPTLEVARNLLGTYLVVNHRRKQLVGRIVETEAYLGLEDPASHAYRGQTERNRVMWDEGGLVYVYFTYGMHHCLNVVTEAPGKAAAVLIRAVEPVRGVEEMEKRRRMRLGKLTALSKVEGRLGPDLTNGPAKLCSAFGIDKSFYGADLCGDHIWIEKRERPWEPIGRSGRVGVNAASDQPWRFYLFGNRFVSKARPAREENNHDHAH